MTAPDGRRGELLESFWAYERALQSNDVDGMSAWFVATSEALRSDPQALLAGSGAITEFRRRRPPVGARTVERLHLRWLADGAAILLAETRARDGSRSTQLQAWRRDSDGWRIVVAQVTPVPAAPALSRAPDDDSAVWRVHGSPLVAPAGRGPLTGLSVAVKDLFAVRGQAVGLGNPTWLASAPIQDAHAGMVQTLLDLGAEVAGITQTDELAFSIAGANPHYGTPANPVAPGRLPGGSSSGCAVAVASGAASVGLGTDTAGSVRVPASYCGIYGLRCTQGALPTDGMAGLAPSFDAVGLMCAELETLTRVVDALHAAPGPSDISRLLVVADLVRLAEEAVQESFRAAVLALAGRRDLEVSCIQPWAAADLQRWFHAFRTVQAAEAWQLRGAWIQARPQALGPDVRARFEAGARTTGEELAAARAIVAESRAALLSLVGDGTALVLPTTSGPAPAVGLGHEQLDAVRSGTLRLTFLASLSGLPALSAPLLSSSGLPVGLSAVGCPRSEPSLLRLVAP